MNRILRFIYAALIVSTAVACHTSEIDNPNNDNPDEPKAYDNIILTASIKQTRVDYSINGDKLEQRWAENDVIYGFYGDTKVAKDKKIVFTVNSVAESGVASLSPGDGWSDFLSVYKGGNLAIRLVYTGCTTTELSDLFETNGDILIDMTNQGTDRIPACMHAESYDERSEGDITYIQFQFDNDCSIIEVFSFSGVKENHSYISGDSATLGSIQVSNIFETGKYSLDDTGKLTFAGIESTTDSPATINFSDDEWKVTTAGDITYAGNIKPVFIAAVPFDTSRDITVSAKLSGGEDSFFNQTYTGRTFEKGNSYYIMANPVIAKTVDNTYFKTVYDAFKHAEYLDGNPSLLQGRTNTVTLLVDEINGLGEQVAKPAYDKPITIDYDVTLDLNGCSLDLFGTETFTVQSNGEFTVTDFTEDCSGEVWSESTTPVITNEGNVSIQNIVLFPDNVSVDNKSTGSLVIEGSNVQSYENTAIINAGTVTISNRSEIRGNGDYVIQNSGHCSLTINNSDVDPEEDNDCYATVYFENSDEASQAIFNMTGGQIGGGLNEPSSCDAIQLNGNVKATISRNAKVYSHSDKAVSISAIYDKDNKVVVSGGEITITGGEFSSVQKYALYIDAAEANVIGGDFTSTSECAVVNYGTLTIGEENPSKKEEINIESKSTTNQCPAIYSIDAECTMYYGTVKGEVGAIHVDGGEFSIYDGTMESKQHYAIEALDCDIIIGDSSSGTPEIKTKDAFTTDGFTIPAVFASGSTLTMKNGNIYGDSGAVFITSNSEADILGGKMYCIHGTTLEVGDGTICTISGGIIGRTFEEGTYEVIINKETVTRPFDDNGYALQMDEGSTCTITGGIIYNTDGIKNPAIWVNGSSLTIDWKRDDFDKPITTTWEPLIYSSITSVESDTISSSVVSQRTEDSSVSVVLLGGYYFSQNLGNGTSVFYSDNSGSDGYAYLSSLGTVYSNISTVHIHGSTQNTSGTEDGVSIITESPVGDLESIIKARQYDEGVNSHKYYFLDPDNGNTLDFRYEIETTSKQLKH